MLSIFFGFSGRIGRRNFLLVNAVATAILIFAFFEVYWVTFQVNVMGVEPTSEMGGKLIERIYGYLTEHLGTSILAVVISGWMNYAAWFKRFQDFGFQGFYYLIVCLVTRVPVVGPLVYFLIFLFCLFFPGEKTSNHYGAEKHSLFGEPIPVSDENWQDRVNSHRSELRGEQVERNEAKAARNEPRKRRTAVQGPRGFGKRV